MSSRRRFLGRARYSAAYGWLYLAWLADPPRLRIVVTPWSARNLDALRVLERWTRRRRRRRRRAFGS